MPEKPLDYLGNAQILAVAEAQELATEESGGDDSDDDWVIPVVITIVLLFLIGGGVGIFFFMKKIKSRSAILPNKTPISPLPPSTQMTDIVNTGPQQATKETVPDSKQPKSLPNLATNDDVQMGMDSVLPQSVANGQSGTETINKLSSNSGIAGLKNTNSRNNGSFATRDEEIGVGHKGEPMMIAIDRTNHLYNTNTSVSNLLDGVDRFGSKNVSKDLNYQ